MIVSCQSMVSPEVKLPTSEFSAVEPLTRPRGFSRSPASPLQKPPLPLAPGSQRLAPSRSASLAPGSSSGPYGPVSPRQPLALRLSHTLKTPAASLSSGLALAPRRRPLLAADSAQGRGLTAPSPRAARCRAAPGPHWRTPHPGCSWRPSPTLRPATLRRTRRLPDAAGEGGA